MFGCDYNHDNATIYCYFPTHLSQAPSIIIGLENGCSPGRREAII